MARIILWLFLIIKSKILLCSARNNSDVYNEGPAAKTTSPKPHLTNTMRKADSSYALSRDKLAFKLPPLSGLCDPAGGPSYLNIAIVVLVAITLLIPAFFPASAAEILDKPALSDISQLKLDFSVIEKGKGTRDNQVFLKAANLSGLSDSGQLKAQFEVKPQNPIIRTLEPSIGNLFDGTGIIEGPLVNAGGDSQAIFDAPGLSSDLGNVALNAPYTISMPANAYPDSGTKFTNGINSNPDYIGFGKNISCADNSISVDFDVDLLSMRNIYKAVIYTGRDWFSLDGDFGPATRAKWVDIFTSQNGTDYSFIGRYDNSVSLASNLTFNFGAVNGARYLKFRVINDADCSSNSKVWLYVREGEVYAQSYSQPIESGYHWRARVVDELGRSSAWTPFGANTDGGPSAAPEADFYFDFTAPEKPATPSTYTPTFDSTPTFSWNTSTDNLSGIDGYKVNISTQPPGSTPDVLDGEFASQNSFTPANPIPVGTYNIWISALDKAGNESVVSDVATFEITSFKDLGLAAPRNLVVSAANLSTNIVDINWDSPLAGDVAYYKIYRSYSRINDANKASAQFLGTTANLTYVDLSPFTQKTIYYQVSAVDTAGAESNVASLLAPDSDKISVPSRPLSFTWSTKADFENNDSTINTPTTRNKIDTVFLNGDLLLDQLPSSEFGNGSEGDLVVDGTIAANSTDGLKHDANNPLVLNGVHNYQNVVLQNNAVVTHTLASGGLELYVSQKLFIDASSKINASGKGYAAYSGPGSPPAPAPNGAGYGGAGGVSVYVNYTYFIGSSYGTEDGSDGMQMGSGSSKAGGGRIKIISKNADIDGQVAANGLGGTLFGSGSAGGGIYIKVNTLDMAATSSLSAAGGGGGGYFQEGRDGGTLGPGIGGRGGDDISQSLGAGAGGNPGSPPGSGGNYVQNGGPSAGGGGGPLFGFEGGGGGAGRIAINYGLYNKSIVNNGRQGYSRPFGNEVIGPYAYFTNSSVFESQGSIGGTSSGSMGLTAYSAAKARWLNIKWDAEPLFSGQNIEFQIRVADTLAGLDTATFVGPDGTANTFFNESNKTIPANVANSHYAELLVKLSSAAGLGTPIIHDVSLEYQAVAAQVPDELEQSDLAGKKLGEGEAIKTTDINLRALGLNGLADSTSLKAQFEIKPIGVPFNESALQDGSVVSPGEDSVAMISRPQGSYHWRARVADDRDRKSDWTNFSSNTENETDFIVDTTAPPKPATPTTASPTQNSKPAWTWPAATDNLSGVKSYQVYLGTTPTNFNIVDGDLVDTNSFTYTNSLDAGNYYLAVKAVDEAGNVGEISDIGSATINFDLPSNLNVVAQLAPSTAIDISWTGSPLNQIDHYNIYRHSERIVDANKNQAELIAEVKAFDFTDNKTFPGESYYYQVAAVDSSGTESGLSIHLKNDNATANNKEVEGSDNTSPHWGFNVSGARCKNCHSIHLAKGQKKIFRKRPAIEVCFTCHDGSGSAFDIRSFYRDKGAHDLFLGDPEDTFIKCTNCHHPHNADNWLGVGGGERMTRAKEEQLCLKCHNETPNATDPNTPGHSMNNWDIKAQFNLDRLTEETHTEPTHGKQCQDCHGPQIKSFNKTRHAITGTTADGLSGAKVECSSCHGPHSVQRGMVGSDHRKRLVDPKNTFNLWQGTFTEFCLRCHRSDNLPQKSGQSDPTFVPFSIQFPQVDSPFFPGWGKTAFLLNPSAHSAVMTCQKCHHPHGSQNPRLNAFFDDTTKTWDTSPEAAKEERLCLQCHKVGNPYGAPDISSVLDKRTSHPIKTRSDRHKDTETPEGLSKGNRHAECYDCHDPHKARAGLHKTGTPFAGGPLTGIKGIGVLNGIPAVSSNILYPVEPIVFEYQLCFKCHSGFVELESDPQGDLKYPPQDKAKELNINNPSYHPIEGLGKNLGIRDEAFAPGTPWNPTPHDDPDYGLDMGGNIDPSYKGNVTCTDCHNNSDPNGAQGPHGSDNRKLLKAPFYYEEEAEGCMNGCHRIRADNAVGENDGNRLCFSCHNEQVYKYGAEGSRFFGRYMNRPIESLHARHVNSGMLGGGTGGPGNKDGNASCFNCHKIHGSDKNPHMLKNSADTGQNWTWIIQYTKKASGEGATCNPSCHTYAVNFNNGRGPDYPEVIYPYPHISGDPTGEIEYNENSVAKIAYKGIWWQESDLLAKGGKYVYAPNHPDNDGASVILDFTGTKVSWYSKKGPEGALAQVFIDGQQVNEIDLASLAENFQPVFLSNTLPSGSHTLTVKLKFRVENNIAGVSASNQKLILDSFKVAP